MEKSNRNIFTTCALSSYPTLFFVIFFFQVRAGPTVSLVFESQTKSKMKGVEVAKQAAAAREAKERAQLKRDELLKELDSDEKIIKKGKFLGLF